MSRWNTILRANGETMFNEPRARATRRRPVIANSHEACAERSHVYSISACCRRIREVRNEKDLQHLLVHRPRCLAVTVESAPTDGHDERNNIHKDTVIAATDVIAGTPGSRRHDCTLYSTAVDSASQTFYYEFKQLFSFVACNICIRMYIY